MCVRRGKRLEKPYNCAMLASMKYYVTVIVLLLLSACNSGEVQDTLGLNRKAPDAFKVVSRPPLSVPPGFDLRPPQPGAPPLMAGSTEEMARDAVFTSGGKAGMATGAAAVTLEGYAPSNVPSAVMPVEASNVATSAEAGFLSQAGAGAADPSIRSQLYEDYINNVQAIDEDASPLESWLGIEDSDDELVDAQAEAERIRANEEAGMPVNAGDVPTRNDADDGVLNKIFD